jgi:hypothetical protein
MIDGTRASASNVSEIPPAHRAQRTRNALAEAQRILRDSPALSSFKVGASRYELARLIDRAELYAVIRHKHGVSVEPWSARARQRATTGSGLETIARLAGVASVFHARWGAAFTADVIALTAGALSAGESFRYAGTPDEAREKRLVQSGAGAGYAALVGVGMIANGLAQGGRVASEMRSWIRSSDGIQATRQSLADPSSSNDVNTSSVETVGAGQMIVLGGWDAAALRTSYRGSPEHWRSTLERFIPLIDHEFQHAVSAGAGWSLDPVTGRQLEPVRELHPWLEEGLTSTLSAWPGRQTQIATAMGLPVISEPDDLLNGHEYDPYVRAHRRLLRLVGIDAADERQYAQAEAFLQSVPAEQIPRHYAAGIARRWNLSTSEKDRLARMIDRSNGNETRLAEIDTLVRASTRLGRDRGEH